MRNERNAEIKAMARPERRFAHGSISPHPSRAFDDLVAYTVGSCVPIRAITAEALLHLPRLADAEGCVAYPDAIEEIQRLTRRWARFVEPVECFATAPQSPLSLDAAQVRLVDKNVAATLLQAFHYLHSPRRDAETMGLFLLDKDYWRIAAVASFSALDVQTLRGALREGVDAENAVVLSRVFAFDWAPRNAISYLLARLERHLVASHPRTRAMLTYLNPNLGFNGASYRASNWQLAAYETGTRYSYFDADYISDRELARRLQLSPNPERLMARVSWSTMKLSPLHVYVRLVGSAAKPREFGPAAILPHPAASWQSTAHAG